MHVDPVNKSYSEKEIKATTTIQRFLRKSWIRKDRAFGSQRLDLIEAVAKHSLENKGFCHLEFNDGYQRASDNQMLGTINFPNSSNAVGLYRFLNNKDLEAEEGVIKLASALGLSGAVYQSRKILVTVDIEKLWALNQSNFVGEELSLRILRASTKAERDELILKATPEERKQLLEDPNVGNNFYDKWRYKFFIRHFVQSAGREVTDVALPIYIFVSNGTVNHSEGDVLGIPEEKKKILQRYFSDLPELSPAIYVPEFFSTTKAKEGLTYSPFHRKVIHVLTTMRSFEDLLSLSIILRLPYFLPEQLGTTPNRVGNFNISLFVARLNVYPDIGHGANDNVLLSLPHIGKHITKRFRQQVERWTGIETVLDRTSFDDKAKNLVIDRINRFKRLLKEHPELTWYEFLKLYDPHLVARFEGLKAIRSRVIPLQNALDSTRANMSQGFVDLLHTPVKGYSRNQWMQFHAYKAGVEKIVEASMPRVINVVIEFAKFFNNKQPFMKEEHGGDTRKFIGLNCCGSTSKTLAVYLLAQGIPAIETGSTWLDHSFIVIPTPSGIDLYVDPTYKQLFFRSERISDLYWHKLKPYLIGTAKDLKEFYLQQPNKLEGPFKGHYWVRGKRENHSLYEVVNTIIDENYSQNPGTLGNIIKKTISSKEMEELKKYGSTLDATLPPLKDVKPSKPLQDFLQNDLNPYLIKMIHYTDPISIVRGSDLISIGYEGMVTLFGLTGYLLREQGYEVHSRGGHLELRNMWHLSVKDNDGKKLIVIPFFKHVLSYWSKHLDASKLPEWREYFYGTEDQLEIVLKGLLGDREKDLYPQGYKFNRNQINEDYMITKIVEGAKDPHYFADSDKRFTDIMEAVNREAIYSGQNQLP